MYPCGMLFAVFRGICGLGVSLADCLLFGRKRFWKDVPSRKGNFECFFSLISLHSCFGSLHLSL